MQKSNANGRFFIDLTIRWHGHEWLLWVEPGGSMVVIWTAGIGAT